MRRTVVLDVPGLSASFLGDRTPHLTALARQGGTRLLRPILPAVGASVRATFTTGALPRSHGIVGSGWYARELAEIHFGRASSKLVEGEKLWEAARKLDAGFTAATLFWSHSMYGSADWSVSPAFVDCADGRRFPDIHTHPASLGSELTKQLGAFPIEDHWGPRASIAATKWIARCARLVYDARLPTLTLASFPYLEVALQRLGPDDPEVGRELEAIDAVIGELLEHVTRDGARAIVLSSSAVVPVSGPVHLNRALRQAQLLAVRREQGLERIDPGASDAFAVADHQIAHVYVQRPEQIAGVKGILEALPGVEKVLDRDAMRVLGLDHPRSGELLAIAAADRWFSYHWWSEDKVAPDYARTVDPARKPGYDPGELFLDPALIFPQLHLAWKSALRAIGFRALIDVVPLNAQVVRGSFGRVSTDAAQAPVLVTSDPELAPDTIIDATDVKRLILDHLFDKPRKRIIAEHPTPMHLQLLSPSTSS